MVDSASLGGGRFLPGLFFMALYFVLYEGSGVPGLGVYLWESPLNTTLHLVFVFFSETVKGPLHCRKVEKWPRLLSCMHCACL